MRVNSRKIIEKLEQLYPPYLADEWDNIGFQIGNVNSVIDKVLICLEVTHAVIDEAVDKCVDLIIAHHPLIFKAPKTLAVHHPKAHLMTRLIKEDINLYVMHTNFDHANGGLSDMMAEQMGLKNISPLIPVFSETLYKLVVYVPEDDIDNVSQAAFNAGAGRMGNYSDCGFYASGIGTFKPHQGATPAIGEINQLTHVREMRFETIVVAPILDQVCHAIKQAHPYEEVAMDIIQLNNKAVSYSLGRMGYLDKPMSTQHFANYLKDCYKLPMIKMSAPVEKDISKVAIISGAGMDFVDQIAQMGADAFVTGDVKYHEVMESRHHNMIVADVGHFESEIIFAKAFAKELIKICDEADYDIVVVPSECECSPFSYY